MRYAVIWLGAVVMALVTAPAGAQKSADTLRVVWWDQLVNVDPYYNQQRSGLVVAHQAWDTLVYRDPETLTIKPLLATSWKYVDDTTLEFELRREVKFHDGSAFTADDVVYTINTVLTDKQVSVPSNFSWIASAEKVDDFKVRVKLKRVFPAALEYLSMVVPIWPQAYRERVGADAYGKAPVGAGPYRITRVDGVNQIEMERFEAYYAGSPKGKPAIRRLVIHQVTDVTTAVNELIGGKADWTWNFIPDNFGNIGAIPTLQVVRAETMRVNFLSMDAAGRSGADNPFTKLKVRQAVFHAIDRLTMAKQLMQGGSRVPDAPCFPTQFGCDAAAAVRYDYDPAKAKQLLAEAGYPNGFDTEIVSYVLSQYEGAIQNYLNAVGIRAHITHLQVSAAIQRSLEGRDPIDLGTWGSYSINDVSAFLPFFFTGSGSDYTRDPEVQSLIEHGGASTDPDKRRKFYSGAIKILTEKAYWLPLYTSVSNYAFSRQLGFRAYSDELPRFFLASWK